MKRLYTIFRALNFVRKYRERRDLGRKYLKIINTCSMQNTSAFHQNKAKDGQYQDSSYSNRTILTTFRKYNLVRIPFVHDKLYLDYHFDPITGKIFIFAWVEGYTKKGVGVNSDFRYLK